jgi:hypothetical protein
LNWASPSQRSLSSSSRAVKTARTSTRTARDGAAGRAMEATQPAPHANTRNVTSSHGFFVGQRKRPAPVTRMLAELVLRDQSNGHRSMWNRHHDVSAPETSWCRPRLRAPPDA